RAAVLPAGGAVGRNAAVHGAGELDRLLRSRVPVDVVVALEAGGGGGVHPQVELVRGDAVLDRDRVEDVRVGGVALGGEAVVVVGERDVVDVERARCAEGIVAGIAVAPGQVLDRDVVVGAEVGLPTG